MMSTPMIRLWYAISALVVSCLVVAGVSVQYANYVDRKSNQRWCQLLSTLDDTNTDQPPRGPAGEQFARDISQLRTDFGCDNYDPKEDR